MTFSPRAKVLNIGTISPQPRSSLSGTRCRTRPRRACWIPGCAGLGNSKKECWRLETRHSSDAVDDQPPLPNSEVEVEAIGNAFGGYDVVILHGR